MSDQNYFVRLPVALEYAVADGEITVTMYLVMTKMHLWADWRTGVVDHVSARRIARAYGSETGNEEDVPSVRTFQRALQGLKEARWIISGYKPGSKNSYPVTICNYFQGGDGDGDRKVLNVSELRHWRETSVSRVADGDGDGTLTGRGRDAERAANQVILSLPAGSSQGDAGDTQVLNSPAKPKAKPASLLPPPAKFKTNSAGKPSQNPTAPTRRTCMKCGEEYPVGVTHDCQYIYQPKKRMKQEAVAPPNAEAEKEKAPTLIAATV